MAFFNDESQAKPTRAASRRSAGRKRLLRLIAASLVCLAFPLLSAHADIDPGSGYYVPHRVAGLQNCPMDSGGGSCFGPSAM